MRGHVSIFLEKRDGTLIHHWQDKNCVVSGVRRVLSKLLMEGDVNFLISQIRLGTGGHVPGDPTTPVEPTHYDIALESEAYALTIESGEWAYVPSNSHDDTGAYALKFTVPLEWDEGNGSGQVIYTEAGIFTLNGIMIARETFPSIVKDAETRVIFMWTLLL
jgi:hypothetical protein